MLQSVSQGFTPVVNPDPSTSTVITSIHKHIDPRKWGIVFSGDKSSSISAFLEQVEERKEPVTFQRGNYSVVGLLQGNALIFYRSIRDDITSWDEFKSRFKKEF